MTDEDKLRKEAERIHRAAQKLVEDISPWLRDRSLELAREAIREIDAGRATEHHAYEAAVQRLVADLRDELERRSSAR